MMCTPPWGARRPPWTSRGAWLGYREVARAFGLPDRTGELTVTSLSDDFMGTNQSRSGFPLLQPDAMERYETYDAADGGYAATAYDGINFPEYL